MLLVHKKDLPKDLGRLSELLGIHSDMRKDRSIVEPLME